GADVPDELPAKRPEPTIATLAHVIPRKRHIDVLDALRHLPDCRWIVIGDGPGLGALQARAAEARLADRVEFLGQLSHDRAQAELGRSHVMVLPSLDEAFGVAYIEALAQGVPAVGLRGEGGPEE